MSSAPGTTQFAPAGDSSPHFLDRWSVPLAEPFARWAGAVPGTNVLEVACGTGALTDFLVDLLGDDPVAAFDPDPDAVAACRHRLPGVDIRRGTIAAVPFSGPFDLAVAQLALPRLPDADAAVRSMAAVVRPGGKVAVSAWDAEGVDLLTHLAGAWADVVPGDLPDALADQAFGRPGELSGLFEGAGLDNVREITLTVTAGFVHVGTLWDALEHGSGPLSVLLGELPALVRTAVREELEVRLGSPDGPFTLDAVARCCRGVVRR